jgi:aspartate/methionine/tyrosine aminotransferase
VAHWKLRDLPVRIEDLEINGPTFYGYAPLNEALANHCGVPVERLVVATGTSMANYLALATVLKPGDEVLIEVPTYEAILATAKHIGAAIRRFPRTAESGFALDPAAVERAITPNTRLVVICNLHNPSSALAEESTIREVGEIARKVGARVMVDEVYLDAAFERAPRSAGLMGDHFMITSSLTKVYGLSGLRCGWMVAEPKLAHAAWRLNDLFGNIPAHMAELASVIALGELPRILKNVRERLDRNRAVLDRFLDGRKDLRTPRFPFGTTIFPKLLSGNVDELCSLLRKKYDTTVVPGKYFEMADHFRLGIGGDTGPLEEGLRRLGMALDEIGGR